MGEVAHSETTAATNQEILRVLHDVVERLDSLAERQDDIVRAIRDLRADRA